MSNLTDKTTVPITWMFSLLVFVLGGVITGTLWVASVNSRLGRIEEHLGIRASTTSSLIVEPIASR